MSKTLSKYFPYVGAKRLSEVEVSKDSSNQHEFNGIKAFKRVFGEEKVTMKTTFILLSDDQESILSESGVLTWYDARANHPTRSEYRLYYSSGEVMEGSAPGDLLIIARSAGGDMLVILAPRNSTSEKQLLWLFGLADIRDQFVLKEYSDSDGEIGFAGRYILSKIGLTPDDSQEDFHDLILATFGKTFPSTKVFSEFSRSTLTRPSSLDDPDGTLLAWVEREELLFKTLENIIVAEQLEKGFGKNGNDVNEFIRFSLSVQNRRKARAGFAFEHSLALIFKQHGISFSQGARTERNNKPDFLFPDIKRYHDNGTDPDLLTMLGVKTSAKDRWRQVLSEASKIPKKHLITLEPAISRNQTDEMLASQLQLVIPAPLFQTYRPEQLENIIGLGHFIELVRERQNAL